MCLKFYPHDKLIRYKSKRLGLNEQSRKEVVELIENSKIVCSNCFIKYQNDLIDDLFRAYGFRLTPGFKNHPGF